MSLVAFPDRYLRENRGGKHEGPAREEAKGGRLPQEENSADGAEEAFHSEEDGRVCGRRGSLSDDLEGKGYTAGKKSAVQEGDSGRKQAFVRMGLGNERGGETQEAAESELTGREFYRIDFRGEAADHEYVESPEEGPGEHKKIAGGHREAAAHRDDVKPYHRDDGRKVVLGACLSPEQRADEGDYDDIEARHESGVAGRRGDQPDLLEARSDEHDASRENKGKQSGRPRAGRTLGAYRLAGRCVGADGLGVRAARPPSVADEGKENKRADRIAHRVEGERAKIVHADPLGNEGETPNRRGEEEESVGVEDGNRWLHVFPYRRF